MARYIAFLRAINVGGHVVKMDRLRALFEQLKLGEVETFIASGNVIFRSTARADALERRIERQLENALGYEVRTFLRTDAELAAVVQHKPFTAARRASSGALSVGFLQQPLDIAASKGLKALSSELDWLETNGRELYWSCAGGQGDSVLSNNVLERALKTQFTFRNITTVRKLAEKYCG
jgi:uncharacterized protein (DUF1697 family)